MALPGKLELIVGIDMGFTCTGVAFYIANELGLPMIANKSYLPTIIPEWPQRKATKGGPIIDEIKHKVPTRLAYRGGVREYLWGFECPPVDPTRKFTIQEHFKLYLEEELWKKAFEGEPDLAPGNIEDVQSWFRDFLTALYKHVASYFERRFGQEVWKTARVEYFFSVPTMWQQPQTRGAVIAEFERSIKEAGFGSIDNQTAEVGMTEAKAAAIYTAMFPKDHHQVIQPDIGAMRNGQAAAHTAMIAFQKGDVLLVCDAGGGTTDVCVLEVRSERDSPIELEQLSQVEGLPIGSVQIDDAFKAFTEERLRHYSVKEALRESAFREPASRYTPNLAAREMTRGDFQHHKHGCGDALADLENVAIAVPGLPANFDCDEAYIKRGCMMFTKQQIQSMFNKEVRDIINLIDKQIRSLELGGSSKRVSHIVLAGGLGSSPYVQTCLSSKYSKSGMKILVSEEPQLAVCKGLVIDRIHRLRNNSSALTIRRCPASFGILIKKDIKQAAISLKSTTHKIRWIIEKGELVEGQTFKLSRIVDVTYPKKVWTDKIVMSTIDKDRLPTHPPVEVVATIESNLYFSSYSNLAPGTTPGVTAIQRRLPGLKPAKLKIDYEINISTSPGGLLLRSRLAGAEKEIGEKLVPINWPILPDVVTDTWDGDEDESDAERNGQPNK